MQKQTKPTQFETWRQRYESQKQQAVFDPEMQLRILKKLIQSLETTKA